MKAIKNSSKLLVLVISLFIFSCKKDKNTNKSSFDINNPQGYAIVMMHTGTQPKPFIAVFNDGNKAALASTNSYGNTTFEVVNDEIIINDDGVKLTFKVQNGKIIAHHNSLKYAELIKVPTENQLAGKTFTGTYYNADGSILHPTFYYFFHSFGNKADVGLKVGTSLRTENYVPMGNVAAFINNGNFVEFVIKMPDGNVISNYRSGATSSYGFLK